MTTFVYINRTTGQPGTRPEEWITSITDPVEQQRVAAIFNTEATRYNNGNAGEPAPEFDEVFQRYLNECDIEHSVVE